MYDVEVDIRITPSQQIEQCALGVQIRGSSFGVKEIPVDARFVYAIELALVGVEVCFAEGPGLGEIHLLEGIFDFEEFVFEFEEAVVDFALSADEGMEVSVCEGLRGRIRLETYFSRMISIQSAQRTRRPRITALPSWGSPSVRLSSPIREA